MKTAGYRVGEREALWVWECEGSMTHCSRLESCPARVCKLLLAYLSASCLTASPAALPQARPNMPSPEQSVFFLTSQPLHTLPPQPGTLCSPRLHLPVSYLSFGFQLGCHVPSGHFPRTAMSGEWLSLHIITVLWTLPLEHPSHCIVVAC